MSWRLAVFAVEEIADGLAAGGVGFAGGLALVGVHGALGGGGGGVSSAAGRALMGKARLVGLEFEFLSADAAGFDGERHWHSYDTTLGSLGSTMGCGLAGKEEIELRSMDSRGRLSPH
jgi:hypothetical protein